MAGYFGDFVIFVLLVVILFLCFGGGIVRVASILFASYIGLQLASYLYVPAANWTTKGGDPGARPVNQMVWFGALWLVGTIIATVAVLNITRYVQLPGLLARMDQIGGVALGLVLAIFSLLIFTLVLRETLYVVWLSGGQKKDFVDFGRQMFTDSRIVTLFKDMSKPLLGILAPWLPKDIPLLSLRS